MKMSANLSGEAREAQVRVQIQRLEKALEEASENLARLEDRLADILQPQEPSKDTAPLQDLVPFAHRLQVTAEGVELLNSKICSINHRLEL